MIDENNLRESLEREEALMFRWLISDAKCDPKMHGRHFYHFSFYGTGNTLRGAIRANPRYREYVEWEEKHGRGRGGMI